MRAAPTGGAGSNPRRLAILAPAEMAAAATMSALCIGLAVLGSLVPFLGSLQLLTVVPFALLAHRHGLRALIASLIAVAVIAGLVAGVGIVTSLVALAILGGIIGELKRRQLGILALLACAAVLVPAAAAGIDLLLYVFASARELMLQNVRSSLRGLGVVLHHLGPAGHAAAPLNALGRLIVQDWAIFAGVAAGAATLAALLSSWVIIGEVLERLAWVGADQPFAPTTARKERVVESDPAPIPVELRQVHFRYGTHEALRGIDLSLRAGQFVAIVGDNGSGKSTLARILAGAQPTDGEVQRPGSVGLGRHGGVALIGQRPDAQVLGLCVRDDVTWGLPAGHTVDVENLLATVGLAGMGDRDTATLSGGELQRLAVAAALAREPRLLISDESTAMVDPDGRAQLIRLFAELPQRWPMTVVHITHNAGELTSADRVVQLAHGRVVAEYEPAAQPNVSQTAASQLSEQQQTSGLHKPSPPVHATAAGRVELRNVTHRYANRTVWEHQALDELTLNAQPGEGVMVVGQNGSGKSTLAWIVAGLLRPTAGACLLDGQPTEMLRGRVGIAFQHARLQLQRPTVGADIADAAGWPRADPENAEARRELDARVAEVLRAVGLEPSLADRSIDQLSGGQQRRVAIAGLLARQPSVLVLDEPLAGLDAPSQAGLIQLLMEMRARRSMTLIAVTHDPHGMRELCPRMIRLAQGRIIEDTDDPSHAPPLNARAA